MKQFNEHLLKFTIEDETIKAEIKISDLCKLFNEAPTNFDYDHPICRVRNPQKFAEYIVKRLMDDAPYEADDVVWSQPLTYIFEQLLEDYKPEFLRYLDD